MTLPPAMASMATRTVIGCRSAKMIGFMKPLGQTAEGPEEANRFRRMIRGRRQLPVLCAGLKAFHSGEWRLDRKAQPSCAVRRCCVHPNGRLVLFGKGRRR